MESGKGTKQVQKWNKKEAWVMSVLAPYHDFCDAVKGSFASFARSYRYFSYAVEETREKRFYRIILIERENQG